MNANSTVCVNMEGSHLPTLLLAVVVVMAKDLGQSFSTGTTRIHTHTPDMASRCRFFFFVLCVVLALLAS